MNVECSPRSGSHQYAGSDGGVSGDDHENDGGDDDDNDENDDNYGISNPNAMKQTQRPQTRHASKRHHLVVNPTLSFVVLNLQSFDEVLIGDVRVDIGPK